MKLYIGNLPWSIDDAKLKGLFSSYNPEEANVITDKFTRRSKGFGFVTIADDAQAAKAIEEFNDKEVEGRAIKVSEARPREDNFSRGDRRESSSEVQEAPLADSEEVNEATEDNIEAEAEADGAVKE